MKVPNGKMLFNHYYDEAKNRDSVTDGTHRHCIGGLWDIVGPMQLDFLKVQGLKPDMSLIDIGCGCLRGGVHFAKYLNPNKYYGIDLSQSLLDAGYNLELKQAGVQCKVPRDHLAMTAKFEVAEFNTTFDMAVAQSVFTHLPWNHLKLCLAALADSMASGGRFFSTFFVPMDGDPWHLPSSHTLGGKITYPDQDPYHYTPQDLEHACSGLPWKLEWVRDWEHPRDQRIASFVRI